MLPVFLSVIVNSLAAEKSWIDAVPFITDLSIEAVSLRSLRVSFNVVVEPLTVKVAVPVRVKP